MFFLSIIQNLYLQKIFPFRWGKRPIDEAQNFGHTQVVEYLNNYALAHKTEREYVENKENEVNEEKSSEKVGQSPLP